MLVIRMQRTGRKGHAMFRIVVQDSRLTPTSGKVVAALGSYDPHGKAIILDKEKAKFYLEHGAQPSERVARLLKSEGVKLPDWVKISADKERTVRNADKRRSTRPDEPEAPAEEAPAKEVASAEEESVAPETAPVEEAEAPAEEVAPEETPAEVPAEAEPKAEKAA
jgi:small subunit ribosomal protein S16